MKSPYISELKPDENAVTGLFLVQAKDVRQKKSGDVFLSLTLADKTGEIDAKMWDQAADVMDTFDRDDFIRVKGVVQIFQNKPQLTIHKLQPVAEREVDLADFFPSSKRDPEEMFQELRGHVAAMTNPHLKALLEALLGDADIAAKFKRAPAAKSIHHAWLGGLLEHVLSLVKLGQFTAQHYPEVDGDLLLTGIVIHDIGKIEELEYERSFQYSDSGQLLGHLMIGLRIVDEKIRQILDFPPRLRTLVEHLIISHHGTLEFGSPKVPLFLEALLLHHLDNLDSKMETMRGAIERDPRIEGTFTGYVAALERPVLKKERYLNPPPPAAAGEPSKPREPEKGPAGKGPGNSSKGPSSDFAAKLAGVWQK